MKHSDERIRPALPLPDEEPVRLVDRHGRRVSHPSFTAPGHAVLADLHRAMVIGRRFNLQAGTLARQGRLTVYPSSTGQEAAQVGGVLALGRQDWLFPTYRDSVALITHGVDPVKALTLFRGGRHPGYDPRRHRCAPQCMPPATNASHAVELTYAARHKGHDVAALAVMGDGTTSGGDVHEAYDFAAVWNAPVVFLVQNDHWAVHVPPRKRTASPASDGPGTRRYRVDGNDAAAVYAVVTRALAEARVGRGPALVEALTYRVDPRSDSDAPQRHHDQAEVDYWLARDPLSRMERLLREEGALGDTEATERSLAAFETDAEKIAATIREHMAGQSAPAVGSLFTDTRETVPSERQDVAAKLRQ